MSKSADTVAHPNENQSTQFGLEDSYLKFVKMRRSVNNPSRMSTSPTAGTSPAMCTSPVTTSARSPVRQLNTPSRTITQYSTSRGYDVSSILSCATPRPPSRRRPFSPPPPPLGPSFYAPPTRPPTSLRRATPNPPRSPTLIRPQPHHAHHHHHRHRYYDQQPQTITTTHIVDLSLLCDTLSRGGARGAAPSGVPQTIELDLTPLINARVNSPRPPTAFLHTSPPPPPPPPPSPSRFNNYMMRPSSPPMRPHPSSSPYYGPPSPQFQPQQAMSPYPPHPSQQSPRVMSQLPAGFPQLPPGLFESFCLSLMMSGFLSPYSMMPTNAGYPAAGSMVMSNPYYRSQPPLPYGQPNPAQMGSHVNIYCQ